MPQCLISMGVALALLLSSSSLLCASQYRFIEVTGSDCIQTDLINTVPEGLFTAVNALQTPLTIANGPPHCGYTGAGM
jgi:hypothetical protein